MLTAYPENQETVILEKGNQVFLFFTIPEIKGVAYIYRKTYPKKGLLGKLFGFPQTPVITPCGYMSIQNNQIQVTRDENAPPEFDNDVEEAAIKEFKSSRLTWRKHHQRKHPQSKSK